MKHLQLTAQRPNLLQVLLSLTLIADRLIHEVRGRERQPIRSPVGDGALGKGGGSAALPRVHRVVGRGVGHAGHSRVEYDVVVVRSHGEYNDDDDDDDDKIEAKNDDNDDDDVGDCCSLRSNYDVIS